MQTPAPTSTKTFNLTIVRHGQTIANLEKVIQGHCDTPLTELGVAQAQSLAQYFARHHNCNRNRHHQNSNAFTKIYSSDLNRALSTCKLIAKASSMQQSAITINGAELTTTTIKIQTDARLRERSYGSRFEGKPIESLQAEAYMFGFNELNFTQYSPAGVESMSEVIARIESFCTDTLFEDAQDGDEILLVTHWATIKEFFKLFQPFTNNSIKQQHLRETPNLAFNIFQITVVKKTTTTLTTKPKACKEEQFELSRVDVICLHQTPHLQANQIFVNIAHQME